jgi:rRNA maturation protein Nop10
MTTISTRRSNYDSQTSEARQRRNDTNEYEFDKCSVCGGVIVIVNGKRGKCAICEMKKPEQVTAEANHAACTLAYTMKDCDNCEFQPDVEPWNVIPDAGTQFIISGGEVLELDSHLESDYDERNGDIETDMPF